MNPSLRFTTTHVSAWERIILVFALIIQQGAFVSVPMVISDVSLAGMREVENPFNTWGVAASLVLMGILCCFIIRQLSFLVNNNFLPVLFLCLVVLSALWSIHPGLTIRRAVGYVLSMLVAAYLPARFDLEAVMKLLSLSFAISAVGSFCLVVFLPQYGIMQQDNDLAGTWQGVFPHKEHLGSVMAVAVFVELYILAARVGKPWRLGLLITFAALVLLSRSKTALLLTLTYVTAALLYLLWKRHILLGLLALTAVVCTLLAMFVLSQYQPAVLLETLGKDATLTGRTDLWTIVLELIKQKPLLGWGYRAMWQPDDTSTGRVEDFVGWGASSSHNAFLEIALQLGWLGVAVMVLIIYVALKRGIKCCSSGLNPLGWFAVVFFSGTVIAGLTLETLGQNQLIEWVVFNILFFSCGSCLASVQHSESILGTTQ